MLRAKTNAKIARIVIVIALLSVPLVAFGATQHETKQNVTLPETIITSEHVAELNETPSEDNTDGTAPIQTLQAPETATDNTTANATGVTLQKPENATDNATDNATGVTIQEPENATDNTTANATGVTLQKPENATDNTSVIGLNYTINESTGESRNINVTESVIGTPKLIAKKESFSLDEEPAFSFEYKTFKKSFNENVTEKASREMLNTVSEEAAAAATGAPQKALKKWVTENETVETCVYDSSGALTDIAPEITKTGDGKFSIKLPRERAFRAGLYKLGVELVKEERVFVEEQEFPWGMVSLNTRKSIYKPGETAEFVIVALDKEGRPVCNVDISLTVINPDNEKTTYSTSDGTITASSECGIYNANYSTVVEGNHTIDITALIDDLEVYFSTHFLVQQDYEFDIIRTAQSKIDPTRQDRFDVTIDIESFTDADSVTLKEFVPAEFDVSPTDAATVLLEDDTKTITWNKDLINKRTSVSYSYSVPHIWPYLYALGPAKIDYDSKSFTEARPWYVAVDPYVTSRPTACTDPDTIATNPANAYDGNHATYAQMTVVKPSNHAHYVMYYAFDIGSFNPSDRINSVNVSFDVNVSGVVNDEWALQFSNDSGTSWSSCREMATGDAARQNFNCSVSVAGWTWNDVNTTLQVRFGTMRVGSADGADFYLYETWANVTDTTGPTVTIINPKNKTYNTVSLTLDTSIGAEAQSCWYSLNGGTNTSFTCGTTVDITANEGSNNISVYANDTLGNIESDIVLFSVNTSIILDISITSPANGTITNDPTPTLTLLAIDKDYPTINYTLYIYYAENGTLYSVGNNGTLNNDTSTDIVLSPAITLIGDSTTYIINATANDSASNSANSSDLYITLEPPWLDLISPGYGYWDNDGNITFTFKYGSPSYPTANGSLYINSIYNQSNVSTNTNTETTFNVTGLAEGKNQNWTINCTMNEASWISVEDTSIFHVDKTVPTITIDEPTTSSPVYRKGGEQFWVNFTYTELYPKFYIVEVGNSSDVINTTTVNYPAGGTDQVANVSFNLSSIAADGKYNVSVDMDDNASNHNISYQNESVVKMSWSNVTWISPPDSSGYTVGETITLTCLVRDANTSFPIENYPVNFYNRTDSTVTYDFGVNYTNSSGYAVMDWDTTGVAAGWYYPKGNITDNATLFYNVSAPYEANTSIELSYATTLEIKNQTNVSAISSLNFSGESGATVINPYNNVDGSGSPQNITSKTPIVTIYNPSSSTDYKIWLKVQNESGWTDIISDEKFNVTADDTSPGAVNSWTTLISWGSYKDTGETVSAGTHKDLYLAYELKGSGTGTSTVSVLGEAV